MTIEDPPSLRLPVRSGTSGRRIVFMRSAAIFVAGGVFFAILFIGLPRVLHERSIHIETSDYFSTHVVVVEDRYYRGDSTRHEISFYKKGFGEKHFIDLGAVSVSGLTSGGVLSGWRDGGFFKNAFGSLDAFIAFEIEEREYEYYPDAGLICARRQED